jgi:hypothetical protein
MTTQPSNLSAMSPQQIEIPVPEQQEPMEEIYEAKFDSFSE